MLFQTLFREKALAQAARQDSVDARMQVTAPHEWLLVLGLGIALLALVAYGLLGRTERSLQIETVVVQPGERYDVLAPASGMVVEVLAKVGDRVAAGQPIARVRTPAGERWSLFMRRLRESMANSDAPQSAAATELLGALLGGPAGEAAPGGTGGSATENITSPHAGELVTLALAAGQRVAASEFAARIRAPSVDPIEALSFVTQEEALLIAPGMQAHVRLAVGGEHAARVLPARVEDVSPRVVSVPSWLAEFGLDPPARSHLLRATLSGSQPRSIVDGADGTLRIVVDRRSLASLLFASDGN